MCDVFDAVVTQDVEGEASGAGEDAGVVSNSAFVLAVGDIADMVVAVLDAPMVSDDVAEGGGGQARSGADVIGGLAARIPHSGGGVSDPGVADDADRGFDEVGPIGSGQGLADGEDFGCARLLSRASPVDGGRGVDGCGEGGERFDSLQQVRLVILELDEQMIVGGQSDFEGFFGRAWHRG